MKLLLAQFFVTFLLLTFATGNSTSLGEIMAEDYTRIQNNLPLSMVIKLSIFCDSQFDILFNYDRARILEYWKVVMYDVHLRLATMPSFNISLQITNFYIFEEPEEMHYLNIGREFCDANSFIRAVQSGLQKWTYSQINQMRAFDIVVLGLGANHPEIHQLPDNKRRGKVCQGRNDDKQRWYNYIMLIMHHHPVEVIAQNIASMLGAPLDTDPDFWHICNATQINPSKYCCVMDNVNRLPFVEPRYFSECTDKVLKQVISNATKTEFSCLSPTEKVKNAIIDTAKLIRNPDKIQKYTMQEQCQLLSRDPKTVSQVEACVVSSCVLQLGKEEFAFAPLEGSACGNNSRGRCFRTQCIEPKYQLMNVGTGKCLASEYGLLLSGDKPVLKDCSKIPFDNLHIQKSNRFKHQYQLAMEYSTEVGLNMKFLQITEKNDTSLEYQAAFYPIVNQKSKWYQMRLANEQQHFLLINDATNACARAADDGVNIQFLSGCLLDDALALWKFVDLEEEDGKQQFIDIGNNVPFCVNSMIVIAFTVLKWK